MLNSDSDDFIHEVPEAIRNWAPDDQCYALGNSLVAFCPSMRTLATLNSKVK